MPYVSPRTRDEMANAGREPHTPGELNYALTQVCLGYLEVHADDGYGALNDVIGALTGAQLELYRTVVAPYEDAAAERNGDIGYDEALTRLKKGR